MKKFILFLIVTGLSVYSFFWVRDHFSPKNNSITNYTANLQRAEQKAATVMSQNNLSIIKQALSSYYASKQKFPGSLDDLVKEGFLNNLPSGNFSYDASTGEVAVQ